jgi:uncharacterized protein (DUF1778 family)
MSAKNEQLQIRVSASQKAALKRAARAAGMDVSSFVLTRALPPLDGQVASILRALAHGRSISFSLAALNDLLAACPPAAYAETVSDKVFIPSLLGKCSPFLQNYVAAMIEHAAQQKRVSAPEWVRHISPLRNPYFATELRSLRLHLIASSPVAFKRRNLFVDSTVGDRV